MIITAMIIATMAIAIMTKNKRLLDALDGLTDWSVRRMQRNWIIAGMLMPSLKEVPNGFAANSLWHFREASLALPTQGTAIPLRDWLPWAIFAELLCRLALYFVGARPGHPAASRGDADEAGEGAQGSAEKAGMAATAEPEG